MQQPRFASVEGFLPSTLRAAALHPVHYWTVLACSAVLLLMGYALPAAVVLLVDAVAIALLPRTGLLRRQLSERALAMARRRAAERLTAPEHAEWCELDALANRTHVLNARRIDLDRLLTMYLNVALTLVHARACVASTTTLRKSTEDEDEPADAEWRERSSDSVARLEGQLATTAALIRRICAGAVAAHVDAAASLWAAEVDDASTALLSDGETAPQL